MKDGRGGGRSFVSFIAAIRKEEEKFNEKNKKKKKKKINTVLRHIWKTFFWVNPSHIEQHL